MKAEYIDHMGDDLRVVNAARVSFDKESKYYQYSDYGTPADWDLCKDDKRLIAYLASHDHFTPFTHCIVSLRETVPIFVARQRFKHMVGFTYNEVSRRYVDSAPEFYQPTEWRLRPEDGIKQGSSNKTINVNPWDKKEFNPLQHWHDTAKAYYVNLIDKGVAPEMARMVLPQSTYTSYYVTGSLAAWARAYKLRIDPHAQKEIQDLAKQWDEIIRPLFPVSWEALTSVETN